MVEIKTQKTSANVTDFINSFADTPQKREDGFALLALFERCTGYSAQMWGPSIIGFGQYHYKSERSKREGEWPLVGFSPRKAAISLYVYTGTAQQDELLQSFGKFKMGKGCIYVKKLSDIDTNVLELLIASAITFLTDKFGKA